MEGLSVAMNTAIEKDRFRGKKIGKDGPSISHLFYADDALFVGEGDINYMRNLACILRCFHASSGLQVNFHKSQVFGVGVDSAQIAGWAKEFGCVSGTFPFTYLGVQVGANMNLKKHWAPVIDRFKSRLSSWKVKHLSFGGRLTLIKSVLSSLPLYYFSLFNAPICVIDKLEQIRRKFLWGGIESNNKINWVAWSTVLASKEKGGLGVGSLRAQNYALLMKWWWRLKENENNIWKDVVTAIHRIQSKPWCNMSNQSISGAWKNIIKVESAITKLGVNFFDIFKIKIGNGKQVSFWKDVWLGSMSFKDRFPALFAIEVQKGCTISDRISSNSFRWNWSSNPCDSVCLPGFRELLHILNAVKLNNDPDRLACIISPYEKYTVYRARCLIDGKITTAGFVGMIWLNWVPLKVNCFAWRVGLGRIPVAKLLKDRGVEVGSTCCKACNIGDEDVDHVFIGCQRVIETRRIILRWCGIQMPSLNSVPELINFVATWGNCSKKKKIFTSIIYAMLWCCWKARNEMVFNNRLKSSMTIAEKIINISFSWFKHRKKSSCMLSDWNRSPFLISL